MKEFAQDATHIVNRGVFGLTLFVVTLLSLTGKMVAAEEKANADGQGITSRASTPWTGNIEERRKAIKAASQQTPPRKETIASIINAMALTQNDVEPKQPEPFNPMQAQLDEIRAQTPALMGVCCEALLSIGDPGHQQVLDGIQSENNWIRYGCAWVLGRAGKKDAVLPLSALLVKKTEDVNVQIEASDALARLGDTRCASYADRALEELPKGTAMIPGWWYAMTTLLAKTDKAAAGKWASVLSRKTQPTAMRVLAANIGGMLDDADSAGMLRDMLKDEEADVRAKTVHSLGKRHDRTAEPILLSLVENGKESGEVRAEAGWSLAQIDNPTGKKTLDEMSQSVSDSGSKRAKALLETLNSALVKEPKATTNAAYEGRYIHFGATGFAWVD